MKATRIALCRVKLTIDIEASWTREGSSIAASEARRFCFSSCHTVLVGSCQINELSQALRCSLAKAGRYAVAIIATFVQEQRLGVLFGEAQSASGREFSCAN